MHYSETSERAESAGSHQFPTTRCSRLHRLSQQPRAVEGVRENCSSRLLIVRSVFPNSSLAETKTAEDIQWKRRFCTSGFRAVPQPSTCGKDDFSLHSTKVSWRRSSIPSSLSVSTIAISTRSRARYTGTISRILFWSEVALKVVHLLAERLLGY